MSQDTYHDPVLYPILQSAGIELDKIRCFRSDFESVSSDWNDWVRISYEERTIDSVMEVTSHFAEGLSLMDQALSEYNLYSSEFTRRYQ